MKINWFRTGQLVVAAYSFGVLSSIVFADFWLALSIAMLGGGLIGLAFSQWWPVIE